MVVYSRGLLKCSHPTEVCMLFFGCVLLQTVSVENWVGVTDEIREHNRSDVVECQSEVEIEW